MNNTQAPHDTPSAATLVKASIVATALAAIVLVTVILPAEYDLDPTGIGGKLGLTVFSGTPAVAAYEIKQPLVDSDQPSQLIEVTVPSGEGIEYKFRMSQSGKMTYEWLTDGEALDLDLHGEPAGDTTGYFESYVVATAKEMKGSFTAPFDGSHGWYWENNTDEDIAVQLKVKGQFEVIGLK